MPRRFLVPAALLAATVAPSAPAAESFPLFGDTAFRQGFFLSFPSTAMGREAEKVLGAGDPAVRPVWRLCQWGTRLSLAGAPGRRLPNGDISYENETKRVVVGTGDPSTRPADRPDLILEVKGGAEYGDRQRQAGEGWPHLLVEQDALRIVPLADLARLDLQASLRLDAFKGYGPTDPALHAAQFQLFFIVKDIGPNAAGDYFWFGVPFFDSRYELPIAHRARDGGKDDATGKFIYTIEGKHVLSTPMIRGEWARVRLDLLPHILEGLAFTAASGFLPNGDPARYAVVNMNLGWEIPGTFDAAAEVRDLAIAATLRPPAPSPGQPARRAEWPEFRGPRGDGTAAPPGGPNPIGLPLRWSETENVVWKTPLAHRGWSTPVVCGKQVWLTTATRDGKDFFAVCVDAETGEVRHSARLFHVEDPEPLGNNVNCYASPSPAIEPDRVYIHFGSYGTACIDTKAFEVVWTRRDLPCRHYRGPGSSAFLFRDLLILTMDGVDVQYLVALDKRTGTTVWKTDRTTAWNDLGPDGKPFDNGDLRKSYSTPLLIEASGGASAQLLSVGSRAATSYDPADGRELWKVRYEGFSNASRPVLGHGLAFLSTGFGTTELWAVRVDGRGDVTDTHVAWKMGLGAPRIPSPVLAGDLLFVVDDSGRATCREAATGTQLWRQNIGGEYAASLLHADGRIYCFSQTGKTVVFRAGREYEALATNALESGFMASPAVAGKALFLRTKTHLYRIEERSPSAGR